MAMRPKTLLDRPPLGLPLGSSTRGAQNSGPTDARRSPAMTSLHHVTAAIRPVPHAVQQATPLAVQTEVDIR
jgi:hypothetical protein